jgi:hypothetical protein
LFFFAPFFLWLHAGWYTLSLMLFVFMFQDILRIKSDTTLNHNLFYNIQGSLSCLMFDHLV